MTTDADRLRVERDMLVTALRSLHAHLTDNPGDTESAKGMCWGFLVEHGQTRERMRREARDLQVFLAETPEQATVRDARERMSLLTRRQYLRRAFADTRSQLT